MILNTKDMEIQYVKMTEENKMNLDTFQIMMN